MTPLMYRRDAKELYGLSGSTNLKNIPTESSGQGIMEDPGSSCFDIVNKYRIAVGL